MPTLINPPAKTEAPEEAVCGATRDWLKDVPEFGPGRLVSVCEKKPGHDNRGWHRSAGAEGEGSVLWNTDDRDSSSEEFGPDDCNGSDRCEVPIHVHGCYSDAGVCEEPAEHSERS